MFVIFAICISCFVGSPYVYFIYCNKTFVLVFIKCIDKNLSSSCSNISFDNFIIVLMSLLSFVWIYYSINVKSTLLFLFLNTNNIICYYVFSIILSNNFIYFKEWTLSAMWTESIHNVYFCFEIRCLISLKIKKSNAIL